MTQIKVEFRQQNGKVKKFNKGKPFQLPNWTVIKHKTVLEQINKLPKNTEEDIKDIEFQYLSIYETLKEIDSTVDLDDIKNLHPMVLSSLFDAVYNAGKFDIYFRGKGEKKGSE